MDGDDDPTPKPLGRPIGLHHPPQRGENSGIDGRSWRQRRDDFVNYEKHLDRREKMAKQMARPYFRDFGMMKHFKGKTFIAPEKVFKRDFALYFPNLRGLTLSKEDPTLEKDTVDVMKGKVSIVSVFSSGWAEHQVATFCSEKQHPELHEILKAEKSMGKAGLAQQVEINVETNTLKYWILRLFAYNIRAQRAKEDWGKYFIVHKGITEETKEAIGLLNNRVGYVYLLDQQCKIRWAGSANADDAEKASMIKAVKRILAEARGAKEETDGQANKGANVGGTRNPGKPKYANRA